MVFISSTSTLSRKAWVPDITETSLKASSLYDTETLYNITFTYILTL